MNKDEQPEDQENTILYIRQGDPKDGFAEISVSPDKLTVIGNFYPPSSGGSFLTYPNVAQKLNDNGIITGVLHEVIQETIFTVNTTHETIKDVVIARGIAPVTEIAEHFVIRKDLVERKPEIDPDASRVDWHSISAFSIVKVREPIARRIATVPGIQGQNVYGEQTPFDIKKMPGFSAGSNVIDHEKGLFAGKSGRLAISGDGVISIEEVLLLKKGVDFTTGNIVFPGDVILQGKIADGFKIYAGGSIVSSEVVDVTEIVCKKDMLVQAGVEGKGRGALRVGGKLSAKYIQNCKVAVRGDITVTGSIMQSKIYSMGFIRMGENAKLVGCECIVIGGIEAFDIGAVRGTKTYLRCGTNFTVQQELDIANEQLKILAFKLQQAEQAYKDEPTSKLEQGIAAIKGKMAEINAKIPTYLPNIDTNDSAYIEVRGSIHPGTELEICHVPYTVTKLQKQVVFRLDKSKGIVISEPWSK